MPYTAWTMPAQAEIKGGFDWFVLAAFMHGWPPVLPWPARDALHTEYRHGCD